MTCEVGASRVSSHRGDGGERDEDTEFSAPVCAPLRLNRGQAVGGDGGHIRKKTTKKKKHPTYFPSSPVWLKIIVGKKTGWILCGQKQLKLGFETVSWLTRSDRFPARHDLPALWPVHDFTASPAQFSSWIAEFYTRAFTAVIVTCE